MRPDSTNKQDKIDKLLEKSWEEPPAHLHKQLMAIPAQVDLLQKREVDRFTTFLNAILIIWSFGLVLFFWAPLEKMISNLSLQILGLSISSIDIFTHPVLGFILLALVGFGWVWVDIDNPKKRYSS